MQCSKVLKNISSGYKGRLGYLGDEMLFLINRREFRPNIIGVIKSPTVELEGKLAIILKGKPLLLESRAEKSIYKIDFKQEIMETFMMPRSRYLYSQNLCPRE